MQLHIVLGCGFDLDIMEGNTEEVDRATGFPAAVSDLGPHAPEEAKPFERTIILDQGEGRIDRDFGGVMIGLLKLHIGKIVEHAGLEDGAAHRLREGPRLLERGRSLIITPDLGQCVREIIVGGKIQRRILKALECTPEILYRPLELLGVRID